MSDPSFHIIAVELPVPLRGPFHYTHDTVIEPGSRVQVNFAHRLLIGIVVPNTHPAPSDIELKPVLTILDSEPLADLSWHQFIKSASNYYIYPRGEVYHQALPVLLRSERGLNEFRAETFELLAPDFSTSAVKQRACVEMLRSGAKTWDELRSEGISRATLKRLIDLDVVRETTPRNSLGGWSLKTPALKPTEEQRIAIDAINSTKGFKSFLLFGITGSGKTEVFLQSIENTLQNGQQVLVLVPEISLTPQTAQRFAARFNANISMLHSGLASGARTKGWIEAHDGRAHIVIGTRSAIFTPMPQLGLIVVDEEHDLSYKQQDGFRYSARDLAVLRAKQLDIPIVLGSATPSFESLANAQRENYQRLDLLQRATGASTPVVEIVDTRTQPKDTGLTPPALEEIKATLDRDEQVLVFINRRGYSPALLCDDCGWIADCRSCTRHLTVHRHRNQLACHHCEEQQPMIYRCPQCFGQRLSAVGQGTERCEERLNELFPHTPVIRIDRDTTRSQQQLLDNLKSVEEGQPCILVGTQMLAKGHHFERITLVVVVDIDAGLYSADFRAAERTGQLMTQVMGRSGRGERPGKVVFQTTLPDHPLLTSLVSDSYDVFSQTLLDERLRLGQPPFFAAALIRADHPHFHRVIALLEELKQLLLPELSSINAQLLGPMPAPLEMKSGRHRAQLWLFSSQRTALHKLLQRVDGHLRAKKLVGGLRWSIDVDPQDNS